MQAGFAEAVLGGVHRVFGYRLQPLSAAHLFAMDAAKLPMMRDEKGITAEGLCLAAKICSSRIRLIDGAWQPAVKWKASLMDAYRVQVCHYSESYLNQQAAAYADYLADYTQSPEKLKLVATKEKPGKDLTSPRLFSIVTRAIPLLGEQRAWSMPYGLLQTYLEVQAELDGAEIAFAPDEAELSAIEEALKLAEENGRKILEELRNEQN